jgi:hypothetical protein
MKTEFITLELNLAAVKENCRQAVEDTLRTQGEPLRWAITHIDDQSQTATVEAVVTQAAQHYHD